MVSSSSATAMLLLVVLPTTLATSDYFVTLTPGSFPSELHWTMDDVPTHYYWLSDDGSSYIGTSSNSIISLSDDEHEVHLYDTFGDGWNGATWTLTKRTIGGDVLETYGPFTCSSSAKCSKSSASSSSAGCEVCATHSFSTMDCNSIVPSAPSNLRATLENTDQLKVSFTKGVCSTGFTVSTTHASVVHTGESSPIYFPLTEAELNLPNFTVTVTAINDMNLTTTQCYNRQLRTR